MAVTPDMIAVALGRTVPDSGSVELAQWAMWIDDALMLISSRLGDLASLDSSKLDYVVREAVAAHVRNPDSASQVTVSVDDASSSRSYKTSYGRVRILDEWWALLSPTQLSGRAFEVDTAPATAGVYGVDYVWVSTTETGPVP